MDYRIDNRVVLTLDAGGTNFEFMAIQGGNEIIPSISLPAQGNHLEKCLDTIKYGFSSLISSLNVEPDAISFAFPGPADYPNGVIGDLPNLSAFRGGVPLGSILEKHFALPVFINNDGDLFAYGESCFGMLPHINNELKAASNSKCYKNLIGITLGTGLGAGIVINGQLLIGDNSIGAEAWLLSSRLNGKLNAEELVSKRSILFTYKELSNADIKGFTPKLIADIALGKVAGNREAAKKAFELYGQGLGDVIANLITIIDGLVVIGGGITGAQALYMPSLISELNRPFEGKNSPSIRLVQRVMDYDNLQDREAFLLNASKIISIEGLNNIFYNNTPCTAITHSRLGAAKAIQLGAYSVAIKMLDN